MASGDFYAMKDHIYMFNGNETAKMYEDTTQADFDRRSSGQVERRHYEEQMRDMEMMKEKMETPVLSSDQLEAYRMALGGVPSSAPASDAPSGLKTLQLIKKSVKQIKADAVSKDAEKRVTDKITRLHKLGIKSQAAILTAELTLRIRLARVMEWNYKVLPYTELEKFELANKVTATRDGLKVHVDSLRDYVGNTTVEVEKKDMVIPDFVLDKLDKAKERQVFDDFGVLWVEKVKDPLLLGCIKGCRDYFLIAEWGEDVKFNDIMKGSKKK